MHKPNMEQHWKLRALELTRGNTSKMGAVVLAILGHEPERRPYFKGLASVDNDGIIWALLYPKNRLIPHLVAICSTQDYRDELMRIAEKTQMSEAEAGEFFAEAQKWIEKDARAKSEIN